MFGWGFESILDKLRLKDKQRMEISAKSHAIFLFSRVSTSIYELFLQMLLEERICSPKGMSYLRFRP